MILGVVTGWEIKIRWVEMRTLYSLSFSRLDIGRKWWMERLRGVAWQPESLAFPHSISLYLIINSEGDTQKIETIGKTWQFSLYSRIPIYRAPIYRNPDLPIYRKLTDIGN